MSQRIRVIGIVVCTLLLGWLTFDLIRLNAEKALWGYRPLFIFLSGWSLQVLIFKKFWWHDQEQLRWLGLATASGCLLGLGFPDLTPIPFLLFIAFVPLLFVEKEILQSGYNRQLSFVFRYSYHTFFLWNTLSTFWVANASLGAGTFAIMVNSLLMCVPILLYHGTNRFMPTLGFFGLVVYWITFEYNHFHWDLSWPWLALGHGFAQWPSLMQWYEYTGVFGGTLWVLVINVLIFRKLNRGNKSWSDWPAITILALIVFPIVFSGWRYQTFEEKGKPVQVAVVQPNFEPHYEKFTIDERTQMRRFLSLSEQVVDEQTQYLVFPESSFGYVETHQIDQYPDVLSLKAFLKQYPNLALVSGFNAYTRFRPGEPLTKNTRTQVNSQGDTSYLEGLNVAIQLSPQEHLVSLYKKSKLVPGPEIFPYQQLLFVFKPIVDKLGGTIEGIGTQPERSVFTSKNGKVAPVICYESIYGSYFTEYIKKGAQAAFVVTNDGWWDDTAGHRQHLYYASIRAIETRRSVARSANTGVSAFVNQRGDIIQATNYGETIAIKETMFFTDTETFYVKWGDIIGRLAFFSSIVLLLNLLVRKRLNT